MTSNEIISIEIMIDTSRSSFMFTPISEVIAKIQRINGVIRTKNQKIISEEERNDFLSSYQISQSQKEAMI